MLYSIHRVMAETFFGTGQVTFKLSQQIPCIVNIFMADYCYSGHNFLAPRENFRPNLPLMADIPYFLRENKNKPLLDFQMFLFDTLLYFYI